MKDRLKLVDIGYKSILSDSSQIISTGKGRLIIGDYVEIESNVKIVLNDFDVKIGDWSHIHSNTLLLGGEGISIGMHCWFGQNSILDGSGSLVIHDGVRVGMYSQIWTHVASGELIEGCLLLGRKKSIIEKDVCLVGSCTVGSGVVIGAKTICLPGSNVIKSLPGNVTAEGSPANVRIGLCLYKDLSLEKKFVLVRKWLKEFALLQNCVLDISEKYVIVCDGKSKIFVLFSPSKEYFYDILRRNINATLVIVDSKRYVSVRTDLEENLVRWLAKGKARLYPAHDLDDMFECS